MKKRLSVLLLIVMLGLCAGPVMAGGNEVNVVVNGAALAEKGLAVDGRTLVPLRAIGEAMGLQVDYWDGMIEVCNADKSLYLGMALGQKTVYVGSESKSQEIDVAPQAINGITMVPIRFIGDFFGSEVNWDQATKTVSVDGVKGAGGKEANTQLPSTSGKKVIIYEEGVTDWAYLKQRGLELVKGDINDVNATVAIKNIGNAMEYDIITVAVYQEVTNKELFRHDFVLSCGELGEVDEFSFTVEEAKGQDCYLIVCPAYV